MTEKQCRFLLNAHSEILSTDEWMQFLGIYSNFWRTFWINILIKTIAIPPVKRHDPPNTCYSNDNLRFESPIFVLQNTICPASIQVLHILMLSVQVPLIPWLSDGNGIAKIFNKREIIRINLLLLCKSRIFGHFFFSHIHLTNKYRFSRQHFYSQNYQWITAIYRHHQLNNLISVAPLIRRFVRWIF
jgi:hypothetical protein